MKIVSALIALSIAAPAGAASAPPTVQITGTTNGSYVVTPQNVTCTSYVGQAAFQRLAPTKPAPNPAVLINLPGIIVGGSGDTDANPPYFVGAMVLHFTSATSGTLAPDYDVDQKTPKLPSGESVSFSGYSQVWSPAAFTLKVSFNILFKNCTLPITALFRAAP